MMGHPPLSLSLPSFLPFAVRCWLLSMRQQRQRDATNYYYYYYGDDDDIGIT